MSKEFIPTTEEQAAYIENQILLIEEGAGKRQPPIPVQNVMNHILKATRYEGRAFREATPRIFLFSGRYLSEEDPHLGQRISVLTQALYFNFGAEVIYALASNRGFKPHSEPENLKIYEQFHGGRTNPTEIIEWLSTPVS